MRLAAEEWALWPWLTLSWKLGSFIVQSSKDVRLCSSLTLFFAKQDSNSHDPPLCSEESINTKPGEKPFLFSGALIALKLWTIYCAGYDFYNWLLDGSYLQSTCYYFSLHYHLVSNGIFLIHSFHTCWVHSGVVLYSKSWKHKDEWDLFLSLEDLTVLRKRKKRE